MAAVNNYDTNDTIVALATPPGVGAIGVIRLSGSKAIEIIAKNWKGKNLLEQASHTAHFGRIKDEQEKIIDEVLATLFIAPSSYTGENTVEVSCHGSAYIIRELIQLFIRQGARMAQPGEFTLRAFLNGKMDLSQAEAVADLIASDSEGAHQLAMQQMRGGFSDEIQKLRKKLIDFASLIELELDFGEEDVEFADRQDLKDLVEKIKKLLSALIESFRLGNVIKKGVSTVIAGRPNAGKSTLLNALLNEERAIVSDIAGTTRDTIEETLNIQGVTFRLIDTAGIREAKDTIEAIGVEKTMEKIQQSGLLVYVFDIQGTKIDEVLNDLDKLIREDLQLLVVCNKMDLNPYFKPEWLTDPLNNEIPEYFFQNHASFKQQENFPKLNTESIITASALNQMNIPYLKEQLYHTAINTQLNRDTVVVSNARHYEALTKAEESLGDVLNGLEQGITGDFLAMDIRRALSFLGEITGEISTDDLLGNIFSQFCIGK